MQNSAEMFESIETYGYCFLFYRERYPIIFSICNKCEPFYGSEIPCRVSSDPHEWHNGLRTVSTKDSVKLHYR